MNFSDTSSKRRLEEQVEDCQNKYGVRVVIRYNDTATDVDTGDGGHDLCVQLLGGGGVSQHEDGWYNTNLRIVRDVVHQLVDHTNKLSSHYFDL